MAIKVLMFGWEFPPLNSGGLGTACFGLTKALNSKGVEVTFVLPKSLDISYKGIKFLFVDSLNAKTKIKRIFSILSPYMNEKEYAYKIKTNGKNTFGRSLIIEAERYGSEAVEVITEQDFDVIHAHDWMSFPAGIYAKEKFNKPLIVHVHSTIMDRTGGDKNTNSDIFRIEKEGMEKADEIITVSQYTKDIIIKHYGILQDKIHVVHNGIDTNDFLSLSSGDEPEINKLKLAGNKIVLFVGRLTIQKGADYFLKAAKKVLEFNPKVVFVIAGSGDMEPQIIEETARLHISDKVLFAGFLRGEELKKIYKLADLFVMPSVSEPFGITTLESVVSGVPVLLSKQSGVKEVLDHALVVDFWDTDEMANKILAVLNYNCLSLTLKNNAFEQIKGVNWEKAADKCIAVYKTVLNKFFGRVAY